MRDASKKDSLNVAVRRPDAPQPRRLDEDPDRHLILLQLGKPPCERTHFLRIALANGGSSSDMRGMVRWQTFSLCSRMSIISAVQ